METISADLPAFTESENSNLILVVDDNPFNRIFLSEILKELNFSVIEVINGSEAIEYVKKHDFYLIFMDMLMPGINGFEATKKIRSMGILTPVIAISAMNFQQDQLRALDAGCNDFLPKPVSAADIKAILKKYNIPANNKVHNNATLQGKSQKENENILFSKYSLLLVEEDQNTEDKYSNILKKLGFNVISVSNGSLALDILKNPNTKPDIVISNLFTSEIDAVGLLSIIKREYPDIFMFIYYTQYDADTFQFAVSQGVDGIIPKDSFENSIAMTIETVIYQSCQKGSKQENADTAKQVRKAQEQLVSIGCDKQCDFFDVGLIPLHEAGGDMAKCIKLNNDGKCVAILGDIAGHSVASSYMSAIFLGLISSIEYENSNPTNFMNELNTKLCKMGYETTHICATIILYDRQLRKVVIATAGNPGGLLVTTDLNGNLSFHELAGGGLCMGLLEMQDLFIAEERILEENSWLFHFSDGIEQEHIREVLLSEPNILRRNSAKGLGLSIIKKIIKNHGQDDDMILLTTYTPSN